MRVIDRSMSSGEPGWSTPHAEAVFAVRVAAWNSDREAIRAVRYTVFVVEQSVPEALEWDGRDGECLHVLAEAAPGEAIGTARLLPTGQIGRMAVVAPWRRRGVGRAMLEALVDRARQAGHEAVTLHAQLSAIDFYARSGFVAHGEVFMDANIAHRHMTRQLTQAAQHAAHR